MMFIYMNNIYTYIICLHHYFGIDSVAMSLRTTERGRRSERAMRSGRTHEGRKIYKNSSKHIQVWITHPMWSIVSVSLILDKKLANFDSLIICQSIDFLKFFKYFHPFLQHHPPQTESCGKFVLILKASWFPLTKTSSDENVITFILQLVV